MGYIHIEDVVTGEIECSKVTPIPTDISEADMNAWFDEILIEDKTLQERELKAMLLPSEKCEVGGNKYTPKG